jgi:O-methyltransferase
MLKLKTKRKLKGLLYMYKIHRFIPYKKLDLLSHLGYASKWIADHREMGFTDFYTGDINHSYRDKLHTYIIDKEELHGAIDYLEFGVSTGLSFRKWVGLNQHANSRFYGFDTFTGLPEDWGHFKAGDMANGNEPPKIDDERIAFYQGLFQQTLIPFLKEYKSSQRKVIHMDADLYSATLYVLTLLTPFLNSGDIIMFDEFNVPLDEFKAFKEWTESFYIEYEVLGEVNNYYQMALKIK